MNQQLNKSYKGLFPFKIGTTSYIYPDHILPNVRLLAPYLDEIELIFFESGGEDNLPSAENVRQMVSIAGEAGLTYNVHLPLDVFLGDEDPAVREQGVQSVQEIIWRTAPLEPSSYTIHFELKKPDGKHYNDLDGWRKQLHHSMREILSTGVETSKIAVETLHYPFAYVEGIVSDFNLSVCLDLGHLMVQGYSVSDHAQRYLDKTLVAHVHGVKDGKDHRSLAVLDEKDLETICRILTGFRGVVSIEVFSFGDLDTSLKRLESQWQEGT